ncbi:MAG: type II toxin-antitoxin system VapB family antitoxin [Cyanobacteria bacterium]|nr:type II toxin-antitoxin system VapB family antitoxin [Cyanobacteriota bacterium]
MGTCWQDGNGPPLLTPGCARFPCCQASGVRSKREAVELGLRTLVKLQQQAEIRAFRGRLHWEGDLEFSRLDEEPAEKST